MKEHPIIKGMTAFVVFFKWLEVVVVLWFLRLFSPFCLGWGLWDVWFYLQGDHSEERTADASIRTTAGIILLLCWFFLSRRKGPWTLNKNGNMERWPWAKEPKPAQAALRLPKSPYESAGRDRYT